MDYKVIFHFPSCTLPPQTVEILGIIKQLGLITTTGNVFSDIYAYMNLKWTNLSVK